MAEPAFIFLWPRGAARLHDGDADEQLLQLAQQRLHLGVRGVVHAQAVRGRAVQLLDRAQRRQARHACRPPAHRLRARRQQRVGCLRRNHRSGRAPVRCKYRTQSSAATARSAASR